MYFVDYYLSTHYNFSMNRDELIKHYTSLLDIGSYDDISLNGLQISMSNKDIKKVAFAVDASMDTICQAADNGADLLFVHHGLFWGSPIAISGMHYHRVKKALDSDMGLFACHIPLDAHPIYGNNAQMALRLGLNSYDPFGEWRGKNVGFKGRLPFAMTANEIARILGFSEDEGLRIINFGKDMIESVAIISGGASSDVKDAIKECVDCYITGEAEHSDYSFVKESNMTMIAGGHYKSEVFGVQAVMRYTEKELGIETIFIDAPTGL